MPGRTCVWRRPTCNASICCRSTRTTKTRCRWRRFATPRLQARSTCGDAEVQQWLTRCLGRRRQTLDLALQHARRGLELCPLQGEGYLHLAELAFLEGADAAAKTAYIDQALRVRAYDGAVLFEAGREAWLAADFARGIDYWQRSFRSGRTQQKQLIGLLADRVPVAFILETFAPDLYALRILHARYRELDQPEPLEEFRRHYARVVEQKAQGLSGKEAAAAGSKAAGSIV